MVIFELGTFDGRTTINLAANAPDGAKIYTIDLPKSGIGEARFGLSSDEIKYIDKAMSGIRFINTLEASKIVQLFGDTANFDFSKWYNQVDLVFVDASHVETYVRNDTQIALKLIGSRDGVIIWHDYDSVWGDVTKVLDEYHRYDACLKNLIRIHGTSLALCEPNSYKLKKITFDSKEIELALTYWRRYPDVAANDYYGEHGKLELMGARQHFEDFGQSEGRIWGL